MTRSLLMTAVCGLVAAVVCFTIAGSMGGFNWSDLKGRTFEFGFGDFEDYGGHGAAVDGGGPTVTRDLKWDGATELSIGVPADVTYTQGAPAHLVITGPKGTADQVEVHDGRLRLNRRVRAAETLQIALTAPDVTEFSLPGSHSLHIQGYDQDRLEVRLAGSGSVDAKGRARQVEVHIAGSGDADLGGVQADDGEVHIAGSGNATVSPKRRAEVHIAGSGDVTLMTDPPNVEQHVVGSGHIVRAAPPAAAPATTPAQPKTPV